MKDRNRLRAGSAPSVNPACAPERPPVSRDLAAAPIAQHEPQALQPPQQQHARRLRSLGELTAADPDRLHALAAAFVKATLVDLQQLRHLHRAGDLEALSQLAHRIKGAAQMTGDTQIVALCAELHLACRAPRANAATVNACVRHLDAALEEFGESCQRMMQDLPPSVR